MTTATQADALTEAFHAVFDVKDTLQPGSEAFRTAYDAIARIEDLLVAVGGQRPQRFDGQGR